MKIETISDFRRAVRNGPYAWPGGYPLFFICSDGAALSFAAARERRRCILEALAHNLDNGWRVVAVEVNWEDAYLVCDHTGKPIEAAYTTEVRP